MLGSVEAYLLTELIHRGLSVLEEGGIDLCFSFAEAHLDKHGF
jgi:hypothetical protein